MKATPAPGLPAPHPLETILDRQMLLREVRASGKSREVFAREKGISRTTLWHYEKQAARGALALLDGRRGRSGRRVEIDAPAVAALLICASSQEPEQTSTRTGGCARRREASATVPLSAPARLRSKISRSGRCSRQATRASAAVATPATTR